MATTQITAGAGGYAELPAGRSGPHPIDTSDDLLWLGYEAAFPAAWMSLPLLGDEAQQVS